VNVTAAAAIDLSTWGMLYASHERSGISESAGVVSFSVQAARQKQAPHIVTFCDQYEIGKRK